MSKHFELMQQVESERVAVASVESSPIREADIDSRPMASQWASEEVLRLVQQILLLQVPEPPRVIVFAGVDHGNGCSRICACVADALAANNRGHVCLVEANFRTPSLPGMFGVNNHFGFTEALVREAPIGTFTRTVLRDNLFLLTSGTLAPDSTNLLASEQLRTRVQELRRQFDFVIIDAPPLNRYSDGVLLGQLADGLVLVVEANSTRKEAAASVAQNLRTANVPILAAILNKRTFPIPEKIYNLF